MASAAAPSGDGLTAEYRVAPADYRQALARLEPGDTLHLAPGEYLSGLPLHRLNGEPGRPIVITGPADGKSAVFRARPGANTISIVDASHIVVRYLYLAGDGVPVDAVKAEGHAKWAHHITLEHLTLRGYGADQLTVGISTKCPAWGWVVRGNTIVDAGTGMYFGHSNGSAPFVAGLIERNLIVNPTGYALQIKHQRERPQINGMPTGDSRTVIRGNVFVKSERGSVGDLARPNVLVGHFPPTGTGARDVYVVYGNLFYDNPTEALFQGEGNIALYNNLFVNPRGDAVAIQPHNHFPRAVAVFNNTVVAAGAGIRLSGGEPGFARYVGGNAVFAADPLRVEGAAENFVAAFDRAEEVLIAPFSGLGNLDLTPRPGRLGNRPAASVPLADLPGYTRDYLGRTRLGRYYGACQPASPAGRQVPCR